MQIAEIHRYPIKSMLGEQLERAELTEHGLAGDRGWALKDEVRGALTGAKRFAELMSYAARYVEEPTAEQRSPAVEIRARGRTLSSADGNVNDTLSELLGHRVSLWPLLPPELEAHYRREPLPEGTDIETMLRQLFARTPEEPLPDVSQFPEILATHESPPGTYFDAFPLLLLTRSALGELERRARSAGNASIFDARRFRPNLLIDTPDAGFVEDDWVGRELRMGDAIIKVEMPCPRCIMTTHGFDDLPKDPKVMRALVQHHGGDLGVYASVLQPGVIEVGARLEPC